MQLTPLALQVMNEDLPRLNGYNIPHTVKDGCLEVVITNTDGQPWCISIGHMTYLTDGEVEELVDYEASINLDTGEVTRV